MMLNDYRAARSIREFEKGMDIYVFGGTHVRKHGVGCSVESWEILC